MFKIGDQVTWTSQSAGLTATKKGAVVEIVMSGARPSGVKEPGMPRDHESYVVRASTEKNPKRTRLYWPQVKNLKSAYGGPFNEQALRSEIVRVWGPAGAHIEVYDMLLKKAEVADALAASSSAGT